MSARVFIHPSCMQMHRYPGVIAGLEAHGYVATELAAFCIKPKVTEITRIIEQSPRRYLLERLDGVRFERFLPQEAA